MLGVALGEGSGGIALLAAIFAAPEALVSSASMREQGSYEAFILGTWTLCAVLLIFAMVIGAGPLSRATHESLSLPLAFAAGAVLAALADTIMPEAYKHGGPTVALSTAAGFMVLSSFRCCKAHCPPTYRRTARPLRNTATTRLRPTQDKQGLERCVSRKAHLLVPCDTDP